MGLDGGTYITRSDVLRRQSWALAQQDTSRSTRGGNATTATPPSSEADQQSRRAMQWSTCTLSGQPLRTEVVADYLGALYNREAVLEFLLMRSGILADDDSEHRYANMLRQAEAALSHLRTKKDIFTVHLLADSGPAAAMSKQAAEPAIYECPLQHVRCDMQQFSALSSCGHIFSDRALKQVTDACCPLCSTAFANDNIIAVNGTPEAVAGLRRTLLARTKARRGNSKKRRRCDTLLHAEQLTIDQAHTAAA